MIKLIFESDYRSKVLYVSFEEGSCIKESRDVQDMQKQWFKALSSWHSPYKALIDCTNLLFDCDKETDKISDELTKFFKLLSKFFLKKSAGFGRFEEKHHELLPFQVFQTKEEASKELAIRQRKLDPKINDFRSLIQFDNHFRQHVVELSFRQEAFFDEVEKIKILESKLMNNLMLWHSSWSLLIDCKNLEFDEKVFSHFERMQKMLTGFFLKKIIGYMPKNRTLKYPFPVYLSRHKSANILKGEIPRVSGDDANCASRKGP